jgi:hypothetical protein
MRVACESFQCDDGIARPTVVAKVEAPDGTSCTERFLVDTGADRTVFSASVLNTLVLILQAGQSAFGLQGVGGSSSSLPATAVVEFARDDGGVVRMRGGFVAFTDPLASDLSILGRNILDHFDLIVSRRRDEVLLLAGNHEYLVRT